MVRGENTVLVVGAVGVVAVVGKVTHVVNGVNFVVVSPGLVVVVGYVRVRQVVSTGYVCVTQVELMYGVVVAVVPPDLFVVSV